MDDPDVLFRTDLELSRDFNRYMQDKRPKCKRTITHYREISAATAPLVAKNYGEVVIRAEDVVGKADMYGGGLRLTEAAAERYGLNFYEKKDDELDFL